MILVYFPSGGCVHDSSIVNEDSSSLFEKRNKEKKIDHPLYTQILTKN